MWAILLGALFAFYPCRHRRYPERTVVHQQLVSVSVSWVVLDPSFFPKRVGFGAGGRNEDCRYDRIRPEYGVQCCLVCALFFSSMSWSVELYAVALGLRGHTRPRPFKL